MEKSITVGGLGRASVKPDTAEITLSVRARDSDYEKAMKEAQEKTGAVTRAVKDAGFSEEALKTVNFTAAADYDRERTPDGGFREVFLGYRVSHELRLTFPFEMAALSKALRAVSESGARAGLRIAFLAQNPEKARDEALTEAAKDAQKTAQTLCEAAGVKLGALLKIECESAEPVRESFSLDENAAMVMRAAAVPDLRPDDIRITQTARFTWEIEA